MPMFKVEREGTIMELRDGNQLSAFLNSGWKLCEEKADPAPKAEPEKPVKRRKKASK